MTESSTYLQKGRTPMTPDFASFAEPDLGTVIWLLGRGASMACGLVWTVPPQRGPEPPSARAQ
jgi:hypothetical protein